MNKELEKLYQEDRVDRGEKLWEKNRELFLDRDKERLDRTLMLISEGKISHPADYFYAAMILQHGTGTKHYEVAHELAKKAVDMGYQKQENGVDPLWLVAATKDRALMSQGKPQLYGTQFKKDSENGQWYLYDINPLVTDEERTLWHVRPLEDTRKMLTKMNQDENKLRNK